MKKDARLGMRPCRTIRIWSVPEGKVLREYDGQADNVSPSESKLFLLSADHDHTVELWDAATGLPYRSFIGHAGPVVSTGFSPDGTRIVSASMDSTTRVWDAQTGQELVRMIGSLDGNQVAITPKGFFTASQRDTDMLAIVRGLKVTNIGQVYQSLYNPDLVRMTLSADPRDRAEVERAAEKINLKAVLDSGPPPEVTIVSPSDGSLSAADLATVQLRVTDRENKGVGRIEIRVNGITAAVLPQPPGSGPDYAIPPREVALDPGANVIEAVAYTGCSEHGCNLLASRPARVKVDYTALAGAAKKGRLHVLVIGINGYDDPGRPGFPGFEPLELAANDAEALASALEKAGELRGLYEGKPNIIRLTDAKTADGRPLRDLDAQPTRENIEKAMKKLAGDVGVRDTFIFFAAAHGASKDGRYYLIPKDYDGGGHKEMLKRNAITQDLLQKWFANIKARKALILLDACESGALVANYNRTSSDQPASQANIGRLHEAIGRPILAAAAPGQSARASSEVSTGDGHGYFTRALLDAFALADKTENGGNGNGVVELNELVSYVQTAVPRLAQPRAKAGEKHAVAQLAPSQPKVETRGFIGGTALEDEREQPRFGSLGEDFPIVTAQR